VHSLLKYSRPSALKVEPVEVGYLIEESVALLKDSVDISKVKMSVHIREGHDMVRVDKNQILQVLLNVLLNAFESMPKGGDISVEAFEEKVSPHFSPQKAYVIKITDTGAGIKKDQAAKIFEPFFTTKTDSKGIGLGLFISKAIVESHSGKIAFESRENKGTAITIMLPLD